MATAVSTTPVPQARSGRPAPFKRSAGVFAIAFDVNIDSLRANNAGPYNNAHLERRRGPHREGFSWQRGSVHFGGPEIDAVACMLTAQELGRTPPWFAASVRDIRMLRIEELNDLTGAVRRAAGQA